MYIDQNYRYLVFIATILAWLAIGIVLWFWPVTKSKSISTHVSASKKAWLIFAPLETVALLLLYIFMLKWFIPTLILPTVYTALVSVVVLLELLTTWIPDTTGWKHTAHRKTAYGAAFLLPLLIMPILFSEATTAFSKMVTFISLSVMFYILYLLIAVKTARQKHLIYQSIYFACFYLPILSVALR